ncbi:hypothetical protein [Actinoallomurus soli]|uniref:hypothetical protein n=1 Tax=Actinoallomurus soli TaxID=2952535 RepID=UPI0020924AC3|nr:hypothetical protein [Actinoallomurus soli]MCO5967314.1 hypothetical protein [Actinoallomurus soli]
MTVDMHDSANAAEFPNAAEAFDSVGWRTSRRSMAESGAACVQVVGGRLHDDGSITMEVPERSSGVAGEPVILRPATGSGGERARGVVESVPAMGMRGWRGDAGGVGRARAGTHTGVAPYGVVVGGVDGRRSGRSDEVAGLSSGGGVLSAEQVKDAATAVAVQARAADEARLEAAGPVPAWELGSRYCWLVLAGLSGRWPGVALGEMKTASQWPRMTGWRNLVDALAAAEPGAHAYVRFGRFGGVGHAVAVYHTGDEGLVLINPDPSDDAGYTITIGTEQVRDWLAGDVGGREDLRQANAQVSFRDPTGRVVPFGDTRPESESIVQALTDPLHPHTGAPRARTTAEWAATLRQRMNERPLTGNDLRDVSTAVRGRVFAAIEHQAPGQFVTWSQRIATWYGRVDHVPPGTLYWPIVEGADPANAGVLRQAATLIQRMDQGPLSGNDVRDVDRRVRGRVFATIEAKRPYTYVTWRAGQATMYGRVDHVPPGTPFRSIAERVEELDAAAQSAIRAGISPEQFIDNVGAQGFDEATARAAYARARAVVVIQGWPAGTYGPGGGAGDQTGGFEGPGLGGPFVFHAALDPRTANQHEELDRANLDEAIRKRQDTIQDLDGQIRDLTADPGADPTALKELRGSLRDAQALLDRLIHARNTLNAPTAVDPGHDGDDTAVRNIQPADATGNTEHDGTGHNPAPQPDEVVAGQSSDGGVLSAKQVKDAATAVALEAKATDEARLEAAGPVPAWDVGSRYCWLVLTGLSGRWPGAPLGEMKTASQWPRMTGWRNLVDALAAAEPGAHAYIRFGRFSGVGHAIAVYHTGDEGLVLINPDQSEDAGYTITAGTEKVRDWLAGDVGGREDLRQANAQVSFRDPTGRVVPFGDTRPESESIVQALTDPLHPHIGAPRVRTTAERAATLIQRMNERPLTGNDLRHLDPGMRGAVFEAIESLAPGRYVTWSEERGRARATMYGRKQAVPPGTPFRSIAVRADPAPDAEAAARRQAATLIRLMEQGPLTGGELRNVDPGIRGAVFAAIEADFPGMYVTWHERRRGRPATMHGRKQAVPPGTPYRSIADLARAEEPVHRQADLLIQRMNAGPLTRDELRNVDPGIRGAVFAAIEADFPGRYVTWSAGRNTMYSWVQHVPPGTPYRSIAEGVEELDPAAWTAVGDGISLQRFIDDLAARGFDAATARAAYARAVAAGQEQPAETYQPGGGAGDQTGGFEGPGLGGPFVFHAALDPSTAKLDRAHLDDAIRTREDTIQNLQGQIRQLTANPDTDPAVIEELRGSLRDEQALLKPLIRARDTLNVPSAVDPGHDSGDTAVLNARPADATGNTEHDGAGHKPAPHITFNPYDRHNWWSSSRSARDSNGELIPDNEQKCVSAAVLIR